MARKLMHSVFFTIYHVLHAMRAGCRTGTCGRGVSGRAYAIDCVPCVICHVSLCVNLRHRLRQKNYCIAAVLAEAVWNLEREFLREAKCICLHRDARHGRLLIRYQATRGDLVTRSGVLGQLKGAVSGALAKCDATMRAIDRVCTTYANPALKRDAHFDAELKTHIVEAVEAVNVDCAADELLAARIMAIGETYGHQVGLGFKKCSLQCVLLSSGSDPCAVPVAHFVKIRAWGTAFGFVWQRSMYTNKHPSPRPRVPPESLRKPSPPSRSGTPPIVQGKSSRSRFAATSSSRGSSTDLSIINIPLRKRFSTRWT